MRPFKLSLATTEPKPKPAKNTGELLGNLDQVVKTAWPVFLGGAAINLFITYSKLLTGPLAVLWQIGGWISLVIGGYGALSSGFKFDPAGIKNVYGFHSKANYAFPNYYPYGNPNYYFHLHNPYVRRHPNMEGYVNIPRISNALAAKEAPILNTSTYQLTPRNVIEDTNHVFSYIMDVY